MSIAEIARPVAPAPVDVAPAAWSERIHPAAAIVAAILLIMPLLVNGFILFQIFSWAYILGMIGLSLMFLAGYGGMGSIPGAALGALIIGLAEQLGSVYVPTYSIVLTFLIMVVVLAVRPQGLLVRR